MIIITGNQRSGTSMWMQILEQAGLPIIGEKFLANWETSIKEANPSGFYETPFRHGIYYQNNPDLKDGKYFAPFDHLYHTIKIFPKGIVRTDKLYLHRVVSTIRHWKESVQSICALHELERKHLINTCKDKIDLEDRLTNLKRNQTLIHPALTWWENNFVLLRDANTRKLPFRCVSYDKLLQHPSIIIPQVLQWCLMPQKNDILPIYMQGKHPDVEALIANLDIPAAIAVVSPSKKNQNRDSIQISDFPFRDTVEKTFDDLFYCFDQNQGVISPSLLTDLNRTHQLIEPYILKQKDSIRRKHLTSLQKMTETQ